MADTIPFLKGHGTQNDFVLLPDPDGTVHGHRSAGEMAALTAGLCDRRAGLGADGVIRVVRCDATDDPAAAAGADDGAVWFMDYRNSDGSLSEMCGNGVRVLARYLADHEGTATDATLPIATRGGTKYVTFDPADPTRDVTVDMGTADLLAETKVGVGERSWPATQVSTGNPHAVAFVDDLGDAGPLLEEPAYDAAVFPRGVNVEFVVRRGTRHVAMRVHERGSGETRSCGTGACAVMAAAAAADGVGRGTTYRVDVPGGTLHVTWSEEDHLLLTGPAVLVASGVVEANSVVRNKPGAHDVLDGNDV